MRNNLGLNNLGLCNLNNSIRRFKWRWGEGEGKRICPHSGILLIDCIVTYIDELGMPIDDLSGSPIAANAYPSSLPSYPKIYNSKIKEKID